MKSRREFLKLVAAGSAAVTLGRAGSAAAQAAKAAAKGSSAKHAVARSAAIESELGKQKKSTADTLKTIRDHELPTSAALAFVFKPLKLKKSGRGGHAS
jgi:anaerobic selenocysteine-containing dehydrogenase